MDRVDRWVHRTEQAGQLAGQLAQVQAELVALTAELLGDGGWAGDGVRSPAHWLQVYTGLSPAQSQQLVHVAERVEGLASVVAMMGQGRLTLDQAAPIAAHVPDHAVGEVADLDLLAEHHLEHLLGVAAAHRQLHLWMGRLEPMEDGRQHVRADRRRGADGEPATDAGTTRPAGEGISDEEAVTEVATTTDSNLLAETAYETEGADVPSAQDVERGQS